MALPVTIPNEFANATASIPLSQLDANFNTLANAVNGISDGSETLANVTATVGNITTVNATTVDTTNIEVTNIKAKDGTAAVVLTDSTGAVAVSTPLTANGGVVFNDAGADVDFRVEGDTDANALFVDGTNNNVGIGTNSPLSDGLGGRALTISDDDNATLYFEDTGYESSGDGVGFFSWDNGALSWITASRSGASTTGSTTRMTINASGNLAFPNGNGIDFSASAGGGASSSILDDYEEGTWTPNISANGGGASTFTASSATGYYTKIGNVVWISVQYVYTDRGSVGGNYAWMNLPFATASSLGAFFVQISQSGADTAGYSGLPFSSGATNVIGFRKDNNAASPGYMIGSDFPSSGDVTFLCTYRVT